jgi:hypothetical protein
VVGGWIDSNNNNLSIIKVSSFLILKGHKISIIRSLVVSLVASMKVTMKEEMEIRV